MQVFFTKTGRKADKRDMEMEGKKKKKNLRSHQGGFTLPELVMVLILLTIIAGIAYGAFNRMGVNSELRTAARDIASDFQLARQRAMTENTTLTITFNSGNHTYTVPQPGGGTLTKILADYGGGIKINSITTDAAIVFQPRGTTTSPPGVIVLINNRASTATININSTGRANVTFAMQ